MKVPSNSLIRFSHWSRLNRSIYFYFRRIIRAGMFWKQFPLVNNHTSSLKPLFIVGSGRSGNTLLRAILVAHGEIAIPPESYVLGGMIKEFDQYNNLSWPIVARLILSKFESHPGFAHWGVNMQPIYAKAIDLDSNERTLAGVIDLLYKSYAYQKQPQAKLWGDKTPINTLFLQDIYQVFPNGYYLHILRDGRDAVLSYLNAGLYNDLESAALRWLTSVENVQRFRRILPAHQFCEVRYEEIVQQPEKTLQSVCAFLNIDYRPVMLEFWKVHDTLGDTVLKHHSNLQNPLSSSSIGKWRSEFTLQQQDQITSLLGTKLNQLGYTV